MARQVLTYPDIPPVLTQAVADGRYATAAHNHDAAYEPLDSAYTKAESDAKYLTQALGDARYLQPATAAATYLPLAGGTLTGNLGVGVAPGAWQAGIGAIDIGGVGGGSWYAYPGFTALTLNAYYDNGFKARANAPARVFMLDGAGGVRFDTAPAVAAGAGQTYTTRFLIDGSGRVGIAATPEAWHVNAPVLRIGQRGAINGAAGQSGLTLRENSYYDGAEKAIATGMASYVNITNGTVTIATAPSVAAGAALTHTVRVAVAQTGGITTTPDAGTFHLSMGGLMDFYQETGTGHLLWRRNSGASTVARWIYSVPGLFMVEPIKPYSDGGTTCGDTANRWSCVYTNQVSAGSPGGALVLGTTSSLQMSFGGYGHPLTDNSMYWGHPSYRWATIYVASAPVVGSSLDLKEDITPLDPVACVSSVLETDWVDYVYKAPPFVAPEPDAAMAYDEHDDNETKAAKKVKRDELEDTARKAHAKVLVETAAGRRQKGYVLNSPDHKVGALFGLPDRMNRSDGADLAVVACALQHCLLEIAELKARLA